MQDYTAEERKYLAAKSREVRGASYKKIYVLIDQTTCTNFEWRAGQKITKMLEDDLHAGTIRKFAAERSL